MAALWVPTHVMITVNKASQLIINKNYFATIALGKELYKTSVKYNSTDELEWYEKCELPIPKHGNTAQIKIKVYIENTIRNKFLGQVTIPLKDFDNFEQPKKNWYFLKGKHDSENKNRGMLQVKISFTVKENMSKANKNTSTGKLGSSLKNLKSMLNIHKKDDLLSQGIHSLSANHLDSTIKESVSCSTTDIIDRVPDESIQSKRMSKSLSDLSMNPSDTRHENIPEITVNKSSLDNKKNIITEREKQTNIDSTKTDENLSEISIIKSSLIDKCDSQKRLAQNFDCRIMRRSRLEVLQKNSSESELSRSDSWSGKMFNYRVKSQRSELNWRAIKSISLEGLNWVNPFEHHSYNIHYSTNAVPETEFLVNLDYVSIPRRVIVQYEGKSKEELIVIIYDLQKDRDQQEQNSKELQTKLQKKIEDLQSYTESLLVRVMEFAPNILHH